MVAVGMRDDDLTIIGRSKRGGIVSRDEFGVTRRDLLSAVGAVAAASRGPEGGRPNLCRDLGGVRPPARSSQRDRLARRPHGNDTAPPSPGRKLDLPQAAAGVVSGLPQRNSVPSAQT